MIAHRFAGKTVLVTGAASGIGKATAERLAGEGADLILADINMAGVQAVAAAIAHANPAKVTAQAFDAGDAAACRALIDQAVAAHGRLDVLCNIAGIMDWGPFAAFSDARWERMIRINLSSIFYLTQQAMPHLLKTKGNVVNMSSDAGLMGIAYTTAYCAAKAGVIAMTKSLAVEFAAAGVRVNAICPGGVNTPMNTGNPFPDGVDHKLLMRHWPKLGALAEAEDIAAAVAYLASGDARQITGIALPVDGGQAAG